MMGNIRAGDTLTHHYGGGNSKASWAYITGYKGRRLIWVMIYDVFGQDVTRECIVDDFGNLVPVPENKH